MAVISLKHSQEKRASQTWDNLPQVGGSRWGFIGVIAGVAVVVILIIVIAICCCCKKSKKNKRLKYASQGSDLAALHPSPSFGRDASGAHRTKFTPVRNKGYDEDDAFMANSPRNSMTGGYSSGPPVSSFRPGTSAAYSANGGTARPDEMRNGYYDTNNQVFNSYDRAYQYGPTHTGYADPYGTAASAADNGQFVEPQYVADASSYYPDHASATAMSNTSNGYSVAASPAPTHSAYAGQSPYHTPQHSQYHTSRASSAQPSTYPQSFAVPSTNNAPPPYITYDSSVRGANSSYDNAVVSPPPAKGRAAGGAEI